MKKIKILFNQALLISTGILFCLGIEALIGFLVFHETTVVWEWYAPLSIVIAGFLCAIPTLIILSLENFNGWKLRFRIILHFISVWAVLTGIGFLFHWYQTLVQYGIIMIMYVIIYILVWVIEMWMYAKEDKAINEKVKAIQDEE